jgi:hypothetical protein
MRPWKVKANNRQKHNYTVMMCIYEQTMSSES